jgi:hypothetical protein
MSGEIFYWVTATDSASNESEYSEAVAVRAPLDFGYKLWQNFPNPFNGTTTIPIDIPPQSRGAIEISDLQGRTIRRLSFDGASVSSRSVLWDGRNEHGEIVSTGFYLIQAQFDSWHAIKKAMFIR